MHRLILLTCSALLAAIATSPAQAKSLKWMAGPPGLPSGATFAVVSGDPSKDGDFIIRTKVPANYVVAPHHHPTDETVRVLSGGPLTYGMGDKVDTSSAGSLTKGYHVVMQSGMNHWVSTTAPTELEVSGKGPFAITYVNPKDDPRTK